ncbi:hypothetical protein EBH_0011760 [Eimeria brunetti]|uniref:Uncharacterized protein n=1 Tax=Eimeria brunetti TaxID=51314 RepID=U6LAS9_9EIME|nr:hypothetical protein EBH_0011760 [Eimeria brunetti]
MNLQQQTCHEELGELMEDDTLGYRLHLKRTAVGMMGWPLLEQEMIQCFCTFDLFVLIRQRAAKEWNEYHRAYSANFATKVARAKQIPAADLVGYFLNNAPSELRRAITMRGAIMYKNWKEAAPRLAAMSAPWRPEEEESRKRKQNIELSVAEGAARERRTPIQAGVEVQHQAKEGRQQVQTNKYRLNSGVTFQSRYKVGRVAVRGDPPSLKTVMSRKRVKSYISGGGISVQETKVARRVYCAEQAQQRWSTLVYRGAPVRRS